MTTPEKIRGSDTKLTKELIDQFAELLVEGVSLDIVCDFLGIPQGTCHVWVSKGRTHNSCPEIGDKYEIYGEFEAAIKKAAAEYNIKMVRRVHNNDKGWSRDLAILERRDRKNYGRYDALGGPGPVEQLDPDQKYV